MTHNLRPRFWIESVLAIASAALLVLTLVSADWIEMVLHLDPDAGSGAVEWSIVALTLAASITFSVLARLEWRRARAALGSRSAT